MDESGRLSFLGRRLGPAFELRQIVIAPGAERAYDEAEWRGALVVVERGAIELEGQGGTCHTFADGDMLCLSRLTLRALRNRGDVAVVLSAVSRRR